MAEVGNIVTASAETGADFYLEAAQAAVRRYCGWHVAPAARISGTLGSMGQRVFSLPAQNVTDLSVLILDPLGSEYVEAPDGSWALGGSTIEFAAYVPPSVAAVRYEALAGWDPGDVPDVVSVILQAARRAAQAPAGSVKSQTVNGASVSYGFSGDGAPMVTLLASEKALLAPYRVGRCP